MKMAEFAEGCNGKDVETCGGISQVKNKFLGVSKHGNKWRARVRDPKLKVDLHIGCYRTPEEAAAVVEKKRAEIQEKFKGVDDRNGFDGVKLPYGVRWENGKYRVRICHPKLKKYNPSFGSYDTCDEAAAVAQMKRAELLGFQQGPVSEGERKTVSLSVHTSDVQVPRGVRRIPSGKWVARIRDPVAKTRIWLGTFNTVDEARRAYNEKKVSFATAKMTRAPCDGSEFENWDKPRSKADEVSVKLECELEYNSPASSLVTDCLNNVAHDVQSNHGHGKVHSSPTSVNYAGNSNKPVTDVARRSSDQTGVVKMPPGIRRIPSGKWIARIRDPVAKTQIWLGTFNTVDEALRAYNEKKVLLAAAKMPRAHFDGSEFENMDKPHSKPDETSVKLERELEYNSPASSLVHTSDVQVPRGVRRVSSGKWVARIRDPVAKTQLWLGTFNTVDEARRAYNEKKVSFATAKMTRAPCDGSEFENLDKPRSKVDEVSVKLERELEYNSPASSLVTDCLNVVAHDVQSNHGHGKVHSYPTSIYYAGNSNSASVSDKTHALVFNRKVNLNIVNEYGQLLGEFEELDEQMWLNLPD